MDQPPSGKGCIEIPLKNTDEVIELDLDALPEGDEVLDILKQEQPQISVWVTLAFEYYNQGRHEDFVRFLTYAKDMANTNYDNSDKDKMRCLDGLAAYYVQKAYREKQKDKKRDFFKEALQLYSAADRIIMYEPNHLLCRAYYCLLEGEKLDQADQQFSYVLRETPNNVPALLGKACLSYRKGDYKGALVLYRKALKTLPNGPAGIRLGIGLCQFKLNKMEEAKLAFERVLQLDENNVDAYVGLALTQLNKKDVDSVRTAVQLLSRAYSIDYNNPMVLNHLANHLFYKKDYTKVHNLAIYAFHNTENEGMRAESCYQLARAFHVQGDYDQAFQYYYQSTQFAPQSFVLPYFGLGQMYIHRGDRENAAQCFEKVLKAMPQNYESMKILGSLYSNSLSQEKRQQAKTLLQAVTQQQPDDIEAWIELAQILEDQDLQASLHAYEQASNMLKENVSPDLPPEILNNIASLNFRLGNLAEAKRLYQLALDRCRSEVEHDRNYYAGMSISIRYNLARVHESLHDDVVAERIYRQLLSEQSGYIDCFLRLGCMARDRGQVHEALDYFKESFRVDQDNPEAWSLIGNIHLAKKEFGLAQKKFERILEKHKDDTYALVALGNMWLETLYQPTRDRQKQEKHYERALAMFKHVLKVDPANIWAANGVGCLLAWKGHIAEARDLFAQVRESTADFCDVWMNIAHIYVEQKQYIAAIQMYENCMKKFGREHDTDALMNLARAYYKADKLSDCRRVIIRARHVCPQDKLILYNLCLVLLRSATHALRDEKSTLKMVQTAVSDLKTAQKNFTYLAENGDKTKMNVEQAEKEARQCSDILSQAAYHVQRAKKLDEQEREIKRKQEAEKTAMRQKMKQEEEEQQRKTEELAKKREDQRSTELTKAEQLRISLAQTAAAVKGEGDRGGRRREQSEVEGDEERKERRRSKGRPKGGHGESRRSSRKEEDERFIDDGDDGTPSRRRKSGSGGGTTGLSANKRRRVVMPEFIEDSTSSSSSDEEVAKKKTVEDDDEPEASSSSAESEPAEATEKPKEKSRRKVVQDTDEEEEGQPQEQQEGEGKGEGEPEEGEPMEQDAEASSASEDDE